MQITFLFILFSDIWSHRFQHFSQHFDLNPLSDASKDYTCVNSRYPSYTFSVNVCRPLVGIDSVCVAGTGICEKSTFSSSKIGLAATSFTVNADGSLAMAFPTGWSF